MRCGKPISSTKDVVFCTKQNQKANLHDVERFISHHKFEDAHGQTLRTQFPESNSCQGGWDSGDAQILANGILFLCEWDTLLCTLCISVFESALLFSVLFIIHIPTCLVTSFA